MYIVPALGYWLGYLLKGAIGHNTYITWLKDAVTVFRSAENIEPGRVGNG